MLGGSTYTDLFDWQADDERLTRATTVDDDGRMPLVRDGDVLLDRVARPGGRALAEAAGRIVGVVSTGRRPPEVCAIEHGRARPLTRDGAWLRRAVAEVELDEFRAGDVTCFVVSPPGAGTGAARHGARRRTAGPTSQWHPLPMLESILLAHAGYRVLLPNIHGSTGRGRPFVRALRGDWGGVDADDCHAVRRPRRRGRPRRPRAARRVRPLLRRLPRQLAGRHVRPVRGRRVGERRRQQRLRRGPAPTAGRPTRAAAGIGDATTPEGVELLWRQSPLRHVAAISHAAADAAGRGRPALPARRRRAAVRGAARAGPRGRRTCSIPSRRTSTSAPDGPTGASTGRPA